MRLHLINNLSKVEYDFDNLVDRMSSRLFYDFDIQLQEGMADGEYSYTLYDNNIVVATGLCQIGNYVPENKTYSANTITENNGYIQYGR